MKPEVYCLFCFRGNWKVLGWGADVGKVFHAANLKADAGVLNTTEDGSLPDSTQPCSLRYLPR